MATVIWRRPPRQPGPTMPRGELVLKSPPELSEPLPRGVGPLLMMLPMLAGVGAMAFLYAGRGGGMVTWVTGGLFGVSMVGMMVGSLAAGGGRRRAELDAERRDYMRYLAQVRRRARTAAAAQREALAWAHPEPDTLWSLAGSGRMWERRPTDDDFGEVRVGVGPRRLAVELVAPETRPAEDLEPMSALALRRFVGAHQQVSPVPLAVALRGFGRVMLRGDRPDALGLARSMVSQAVTFHSPDELLVAVVAPRERWTGWDWVKWVPHAHHPERTDAAGPQRLVAESLAELEESLCDPLAGRTRFAPDAPRPEGPHLLVVLDGGRTTPTDALAGPGLAGVTVLEVCGAVPRGAGEWLLCLEVGPGHAFPRAPGCPVTLAVDTGDRGGEPTPLGTADHTGAAQAAALARALAPYRSPGSRRGEGPLETSPGLAEVLGLGDPAALDPLRSWRRRPDRDRLRVPVGTGADGSVVELDLKESARGGAGPHGMLIGATGSGKTTLTVGLVLV
jgi:DNA segregation ATPase FtsK/SpoIIIE, S-DNA-T family